MWFRSHLSQALSHQCYPCAARNPPLFCKPVHGNEYERFSLAAGLSPFQNVRHYGNAAIRAFLLSSAAQEPFIHPSILQLQFQYLLNT
jgi:hypothetical protein